MNTWPIYLMHSHPKLKSLDRREGYIARKPDPPALKARDPSMTLALKRDFKNSTESQLLSLPKEIREMIFNHVMGGMRICLSLSESERKLIAWCHAYYEECTGFQPYAICDFTSIGRRKLGLFGLLLSCRMVYVNFNFSNIYHADVMTSYSEVVGLLYTQNSFDVLELDVLRFLPQLLLRENLDSIRSLEFTWLLKNPPMSFSAPSQLTERARRKTNYYREYWLAVWRNLSEMKGLEELTVKLHIFPPYYERWVPTRSFVAFELEIVRMVTRPKRFELWLQSDLAEVAALVLQGGNLIVMERFGY